MSMFRSSRRQSALDFDLLVPETPTRPVEKKIFNNEVEDAVFEDLSDAEYLSVGNDNRAKAGIQSQRAIRPKFQRLLAMVGAAERKLNRFSIDAFAMLIAAAICAAFLLSGGFSYFAGSKGTDAAPANPLGINYVNIDSQYIDGQDVLVIRGIIANSGNSVVEVPKILASLSAKKGEFVASMIIQPPIREIKPGNSHGFSAKLRHPGGKTPEIKLSFMQTDVSGR